MAVRVSVKLALTVGLVKEFLTPICETGFEPFRMHALYCSFCRKPDTVASRLIAGPGVFICESCIILCARALTQCAPRTSGAAARIECGQDCSTDTLLSQLKGQDATLKDVRERLIATVQTLRCRDVSWEKIGKALGCSRQAAWERFGQIADKAHDKAPAGAGAPRLKTEQT